MEEARLCFCRVRGLGLEESMHGHEGARVEEEIRRREEKRREEEIRRREEERRGEERREGRGFRNGEGDMYVVRDSNYPILSGLALPTP